MSSNPKPVILIYGADPYAPEGSSRPALLIATERAAEAIRAARECQTWGAYAKLCGHTWDDFIEDYGNEVEELTGQDEPGPDSAFRFDDIYGLYYSGDLLPEPQTDAYEILVKLVRRDQRLEGQLEWSGGSPAGHISCVIPRGEMMWSMRSAPLGCSVIG